jgi:hypothetical protein
MWFNIGVRRNSGGPLTVGTVTGRAVSGATRAGTANPPERGETMIRHVGPRQYREYRRISIKPGAMVYYAKDHGLHTKVAIPETVTADRSVRKNGKPLVKCWYFMPLHCPYMLYVMANDPCVEVESE